MSAEAEDWKELFEKALERHKQNALAQAEPLYRRVLDAQPRCADAYYLLGAIAFETKRFDYAIECIETALRYNASQPSWFVGLAKAYRVKNDFQQAQATLHRCLQIDPGYADALIDLGEILAAQGQYSESLNFCKKALAKRPDDVSLLNQLGVVYRILRKKQQSIEMYKRALQIESDNFWVLCNLAMAYFQFGELGKARTIMNRALESRPNDIDALSRLANIVKELGSIDEEIDCYRKILTHEPRHSGALTGLFNCLQAECRWDELTQLGSLLDASTDELLKRSDITQETPFLSLRRNQNSKRNLEVARCWSEKIVAHKQAGSMTLAREPRTVQKTRLKIGYLSGCYGDNPVAHLIRRLFQAHNRDKFHCTMYSYDRNEASPYFNEMRAQADSFVSLLGLDDFTAAKVIAGDEVDILVDLMGHSKGNRFEILSLRPAPIQVSYLGFPGSTGASCLDYILTDEHLTPSTEQPYYTEAFAYLPDCYQINDGQLQASTTVTKRGDWGLPPEGVVFCSFNGLYKIDESLFSCWMNILKRVQGSVLWLFSDSARAETVLKQQAVVKGVDPNRLIFAQRVALGRHLERLRHASLALDTLSYNGGITTSHTLWAGVPLLTVPGRHYASRMSYSILSALDMNSLIVGSLEEYEERAVSLTTNLNDLDSVCQTLLGQIASSSLYNTKRICRHIEEAYKMMHERHASGQRPATLRVASF